MMAISGQFEPGPRPGIQRINSAGRHPLVLCSADPHRLRQTCHPTFDVLTGDDDRAHLHCLADGAILDLSAAFTNIDS